MRPGPPCAVSSFTTPRKTSTYTRGSAAAVAAVVLAATAIPLLLVTLHPLFASTAKLSSASLLSCSRPFGHVFGHALCMAEAEMGQDARAAVEPQPWPAVAAALVASGSSAPLQQMHDLSDPSPSCVQVVSTSHGFVFMRGASGTVSASAALAAPTIEMQRELKMQRKLSDGIRARVDEIRFEKVVCAVLVGLLLCACLLHPLLRSRFRAPRACHYSASHSIRPFSICGVALLLLSIPSAMATQFTPMTSTLVGTTAGHADGSGTSAKFAATPHGVTLSPSGTFALVSDTGNNAVRRIDVASGTVTTLTSTIGAFANGVGTNARFNTPTGMCMADHGRVAFVFDTSRWMRQIDLASTTSGYGANYVTSLVGGTASSGAGSAATGAFARQDGDYYASAYLGNSNTMPNHCVATASGSIVYFTEGGDSAHRVRMANVDTRAVESLAGTLIPSYPINQKGYQDGTGTNAWFFYPSAVALSDDEQTLFITEDKCTRYCTGQPTWNQPTWGNHIRKLDLATRQVTTLAGSTQGFADGTGTNALFNGPRGMVQVNGMLYVADSGNKRSACPALEWPISPPCLLLPLRACLLPLRASLCLDLHLNLRLSLASVSAADHLPSVWIVTRLCSPSDRRCHGRGHDCNRRSGKRKLCGRRSEHGDLLHHARPLDGKRRRHASPGA